MKAINIILDEHRSLAAVLGGMVHLVRDIGEGRSPPDFRVFGTMIYYIDAFPERFHHPKEDAYLFRILRQRDAGAGALIDRLQAGEDKIRALAHALVRYQYGGADEFGQFAAAVEGYAAFHWEHMRAEEDRILPLAREHLSASDWAEIDAAFASNDDPLVGVKAGEAYDALFRRIASLAPPPIGLGFER